MSADKKMPHTSCVLICIICIVFYGSALPITTLSHLGGDHAHIPISITFVTVQYFC